MLHLESTGMDAVAADVMYHRSCYKEFTDSCALKKLEDTAEEMGDSYAQAYAQLFAEVESSVLTGKKVELMPRLRTRFVALLADLGINNEEYRTEKVKRHLRKRFGDRLEFYQAPNRSLPCVVHAANLPAAQVAHLMNVAENEDSMHTSRDEPDCQLDESCSKGNAAAMRINELVRDTYHVARTLRREILDMKTPQWPPSPSDISEAEKLVKVPNLLYNFLAWLMCEDVPSPTFEPIVSGARIHVPSPEVNRVVLSISHDIIYRTTCGRIKSEKHISLPMAVRHLTGSKQVITLLNRFGHGIAITQLQELETCFAEQHLKEQEGENAYLPEPLLAGPFVTLCWDNNDLCEETLSGHGTTHCTNGIAIQRQAFGPQPVGKAGSQTQRSRRRSVAPRFCEVLPYNAGTRCGPPKSNVDASLIGTPSEVHEEFRSDDFAWLLARFSASESTFIGTLPGGQNLPSWSAFNAAVQSSDKQPVRSTVAYCPVIGASPTQLDTVYTLLSRSLAMTKRLDQQTTVVVLDQAIYAKALEVKWKRADEFKSVVLRMGAFHVACVFLAVIGKRFAGSGLRDLMLESGVVAEGSLQGVLSGKHYNRSIRVHKLVMEAMCRLQLEQFGEWLNIQNVRVDLNALQQLLIQLRQQCDHEAFSALRHSESFTQLRDLYSNYCKNLTSPMAKLWQSYIEMVLLLLRFIRATRQGNWSLHKACMKDMLPWFFAYDRTNYARYGSVYWCTMATLATTHPDAEDALASGELSVQRSDHPFAQVAVDMAIEQTVNRDTKTPGGLIGMSTNASATQRWLLTAHDRAAIASSCRDLAGIVHDKSSVHQEATPSRLKRDEEDVQSLISTTRDWANPFVADEEGMFNLSCGARAPADVQEDLLIAERKGATACSDFIRTRLVHLETGFYDTLPKMKLKTLQSLVIKKKVKTANGIVQLRADKALFARLAVLAQNRAMDMRVVMGYPLGPLPWSLALPDGSLVKTNKSKLLHLLEEGVEPLHGNPSGAWIIDGMAVLQALQGRPSTFGDLAILIMQVIMSRQHVSGGRVDVVFDCYWDISIKAAERQKRAADGVLQINISSSSQKCPKQWSKVLKLGSNKTAIIQFLVEEWKKDTYSAFIPDNCDLYATSGAECWRFTSEGGVISCQLVPELRCNHEEADTRILLHAAHAAQNGYSTVYLRSPDTDVAIIAISLASQVPAELVFKTGTKQRSRFINLSAIAIKYGSAAVSMIGLHSFTGCDSCSAFSGKGKKKALGLLKDQQHRHSMMELGQTFNVSSSTMRDLEAFVCALYGRPTLLDVNEARYNLFCAKGSSTAQLPPCRDALQQHAKRANYQAAIWRRALQPWTEAPSANGHGWSIGSDNSITINWTTQLPAPQQLLELVSCSCKKGCGTAMCSCHSNGMQCTDVCQCVDCVNRSQEGESLADESSDNGDASGDESS